MHRIDTSGATVGGLFKQTPAPATQVGSDWLNDVQENLVGVILAAGIGLVKGAYGQLLAALRILGGSRPGRIEMWGGSAAPAGTLECDGSEVLKAVYPALWAAIGDTWGDASDGDHFVLPDLRGRVFRGWDHGAGRDPDRALGSYQDDANKSHRHNTYKATSSSSANDNIVGGQVMTDGNSPPGTLVNWIVQDSGEAEARMKNAAGMFIIQAI